MREITCDFQDATRVTVKRGEQDFSIEIGVHEGYDNVMRFYDKFADDGEVPNERIPDYIYEVEKWLTERFRDEYPDDNVKVGYDNAAAIAEQLLDSRETQKKTPQNTPTSQSSTESTSAA